MVSILFPTNSLSSASGVKILLPISNHYPYRLGPLLLLNNSGPPLIQIFNISPLCSYDSPLAGLPVLRIGTSLNTAIALPKNGCPSRIMWLPCSNTQMDLKHSVMPIASRIKSTPQIGIQSPSWHGLSSAHLLSPPSSLSLCSVIVSWLHLPLQVLLSHACPFTDCSFFNALNHPTPSCPILPLLSLENEGKAT